MREYSDFDEDDDEDKAKWESMEAIYEDAYLWLLSPTDDSDDEKGKALRSTKWRRIRATNGPHYAPDGGTIAWLQVLGSFLINVNNWGLVNSFGVYQTFYQVEYLQGHLPSSIAWIDTVQETLLLVVGVVSGPLFDKGYFQAILIVAGVGVVFDLMMLSLATEYYQVMLSQGILIGVCLGLLYITSVALMPLYFKTKRNLALGLATSGRSLGGNIYPVVFRRILSSHGFS